MLSKLKLENFKSFCSMQEIEFAPITLIFGQNSSGKSSIIQAILGLKQSLANASGTANFVSCGKNVDLGGFLAVVNGHDSSKKMRLSFSFSIGLTAEQYKNEFSEKPIFASSDIRTMDLVFQSINVSEKVDNVLSECRYTVATPNSKQSKLYINLAKGASGYTKSSDWSYYADDKTINSFYGYFERKNSRIYAEATDDINKWIYESLSSGVYKVRKDLSLPLLLASEFMTNIPNETLQSISEEIKYEFSKVKYLGPLRTHPKRFYSTAKDSISETKGETNLGGEIYESGPETVEKLNDWLCNFEIPYIINVSNLGDYTTGHVVSLTLQDTRTNTIVTPVDVGFGIGQVMPIITEAVVSKNTTICVEQPEIHLHPKLQAHLADLFIDSVNAKKNNNQWIIETHSEALMLRIQKRIRQERINKSLVKVYYVISDTEGSKIIDLPLDDEGDFTELWPEGFFEERLNDLFGG